MSASFDLLTDEQIARMKKAAAEMKAVPVAFLKFDVAIWKLGGVDITDSHWLALTDLATTGWKRFENNQVVEKIMVPILEHGNLPRPNSFTDKKQWSQWDGGRPKDPWTKVFALLLQNEATSKIVEFEATSLPAKTAVSALIDDFVTRRRRQVVKLTSELRHVDGKDVHEPMFEIVAHSEDDTPITVATGKQTLSDPEKGTAAVRANGGGYNDMDDDIPF
jgi:hypothetical protein